MNIQFYDDPNLIPQPSDKVFIQSLEATPYPDRFRVLIKIRVTPFQERPNLILAARDAYGKIVADLDIIATMHADMEFTMHLRNIKDPAGTYTLTAELYYETRQPPQDKQSIQFVIPPMDENR